jgi:hypothetical protein
MGAHTDSSRLFSYSSERPNEATTKRGSRGSRPFGGVHEVQLLPPSNMRSSTRTPWAPSIDVTYDSALGQTFGLLADVKHGTAKWRTRRRIGYPAVSPPATYSWAPSQTHEMSEESSL